MHAYTQYNKQHHIYIYTTTTIHYTRTHRKPQEQTGFSDATVTNQDEFEEIIIVSFVVVVVVGRAFLVVVR